MRRGPPWRRRRHGHGHGSHRDDHPGFGPHGPHRRPANPILNYLRGRLRRRLFAWISVAILISAVLTWKLGGGVVAIVAGALVLWIASGVIAFRLTRPLAQLVDITRRIGAGELDARMSPGRMGSGELRMIAVAINDMAERVERTVAGERELLAAVSHELRTPLGHLRVLLDLARQRGAETHVVDELEAEVLAIDNLVGQLLARSRVEFGNHEQQRLDAVELALRALERAGLDPTLLEADAERIELHGDAALLLQALANLIRNAEEHGGGVTRLSVVTAGVATAFEVDDDGPGFPEDELERAFESFHQGHDRAAGGGSLGLGLALVRRIAEAHGGQAYARNRAPGACVGFTVGERAAD